MPPSRRSRNQRKRDKDFVVLKVAANLALGALANDVVIAGDLLDLNDDLKVISTDLTWGMRDHTPGEGSIGVGLNIDSYTVGEIAEALDASPTDRADAIALERSSRKVRTVGKFAGILAEETLNDGKPIRSRKLYWSLANDRDLQLHAVNRSGATLTTGTVITVEGNVYATWT